MNAPAPLRDIYVKVNVLQKIRSRQRLSIEELKKNYYRYQRNYGKKIESKSGIKVINDLEKFIVLGQPGAGKTTFLKSCVLRSLDGEPEKKRIPIFISLKDLSDSKMSLVNFIVKQFDICRFPDAKSFVVRAFENGKCQLLLDGLDEVPNKNLDVIIKEIKDFSDKYDDNQYIISCRGAAYDYWLDKFIDVEIADFDEMQIESFINNWFRKEPDIGQSCLKKLKDNKATFELASTPLLLTLLCICYDELFDFPSNRAELYKESIDALLKKWDSTRRIRRDEVYRYLSV